MAESFLDSIKKLEHRILKSEQSLEAIKNFILEFESQGALRIFINFDECAILDAMLKEYGLKPLEQNSMNGTEWLAKTAFAAGIARAIAEGGVMLTGLFADVSDLVDAFVRSFKDQRNRYPIFKALYSVVGLMKDQYANFFMQPFRGDNDLKTVEIVLERLDKAFPMCMEYSLEGARWILEKEELYEKVDFSPVLRADTFESVICSKERVSESEVNIDINKLCDLTDGTFMGLIMNDVFEVILSQEQVNIPKINEAIVSISESRPYYVSMRYMQAYTIAVAQTIKEAKSDKN